MNPHPEEHDAVAHLIALGYVDPDVTESQQAALRDRRLETLRQASESLKQGQGAEAASLLEQAISADPDWSAAHQTLAEIYSRLKRWPEAQTHLDWLTWRGIESPRLSFMAAGAALARRELHSALDALEYAHHVEPNLPGLTTLLAIVLVRLQRLAEAEELFQEDLALNSADADALAGLAQICLHRGQYGEAADSSLQSLEHNMQLAPAHYRLGVALAYLGQTDAARQAFETFAKLCPDRAASFRWLIHLANEHDQDLSLAASYRDRAREIIERRRQRRAAK